MLELIVLIAVLALAIGLLLPTLVRVKPRSSKISCTYCLKQIGLSARIFANDHGGLFPMAVSTNNGGSMEYVGKGEVFRHLRAMSDELFTAKVVVCPADSRKSAANFSVLSNTNISYFVGLDALDTLPQSLLAGDRNLMTNGVPVANGILFLTTKLTVGWTTGLHNGSGNVVLGDGSVQTLTSARLWQQVTTNRLAIP